MAHGLRHGNRWPDDRDARHTMTKATSNTKSQVFYELFMLGLCVYVLIGLAVTTFIRLDPGVIDILDGVDTLICVVFMTDFFVKLHRAENKLAYLKWGWIDFISSIPAVEPLRLGRFARIVRILRLLRGVRACKVLFEGLLRHRAESGFGTVILMALLIVVFGSIAVLDFERANSASNIKSPEDAIWWAFATVTGVGYGDLYPVTSNGRVVGVLTMVSGLALFATFAGLLTSWFLAPQEAEQDDELEAIRIRLTAIEGHLMELIGRNEQRPVDTSVSVSDLELADLTHLLREFRDHLPSHSHAIDSESAKDADKTVNKCAGRRE